MRKFNGKSNLSGKIIEKYRRNKKMSREDLAQQMQLRALNVDRSYIFRIEKGKAIIKDFELIAISEILEIDCQKLRDEFNKELKSSD